MGILTGLFGLVDMGLGGNILFPIRCRNEIPGILHHIVVDTDRIGTHVGNKTYMTVFADIKAFIQLLGQHHRLLGTEIELADAFLLHRRRRKRRLGLAFTLPLFYFFYAVRLMAGFFLFFPLQGRRNSCGLFPVFNRCFFSVDFRQFRM